MNLVLTKRGQYAVKAARALAMAYDGEYHKTREVVAETGLPARFAPQVLADLREAGITEARAGPSGGHRLSRSPHDISLLEVINAAEHTLIESRCMISGEPCPPAENCFVHPVWAAAQAALLESLEAATLADLVGEERLPDESEPRRGAPIAASR
jgi:Rrf2 family iron-sulfur cluster assembly transcriptional regulator